MLNSTVRETYLTGKQRCSPNNHIHGHYHFLRLRKLVLVQTVDIRMRRLYCRARRQEVLEAEGVHDQLVHQHLVLRKYQDARICQQSVIYQHFQCHLLFDYQPQFLLWIRARKRQLLYHRQFFLLVCQLILNTSNKRLYQHLLLLQILLWYKLMQLLVLWGVLKETACKLKLMHYAINYPGLKTQLNSMLMKKR